MKTPPPSHSIFLAWLAGCIVAAWATGVVLVLLVDPYGLYGLLTVEGLNSIKPGLTRYLNEIKLTHAARLRPNTIILGNSRAEIGFDPESPVFTRNHQSTYNLAISATSISTSRSQVDYLHHIGAPPKNIILGIEFLDFLLARSTVPNEPSSKALSDEHPVNRLFWRFDSLSSLTSIVDALRTLRIQHNNEAITMTSRGFNPLKEYQAYVRNDGYYVMFRQRALENAKRYLTKSKEVKGFKNTNHLQALLDMAANDNINVKLIIYPYHAQNLALFEETGLWPAFEAWKEMLITEVTAARLRHPNASIELFDFSGFGGYRCERIPPKEDHRNVSRWYWEAGHFKKELGDIVLSRVYFPASESKGSLDKNKDTLTDFGTQLDATTRIANQKRIAREREECATQYPELFLEAAGIVASVGRKDEEIHHFP